MSVFFLKIRASDSRRSRLSEMMQTRSLSVTTSLLRASEASQEVLSFCGAAFRPHNHNLYVPSQYFFPFLPGESTRAITLIPMGPRALIGTQGSVGRRISQRRLGVKCVVPALSVSLDDGKRRSKSNRRYWRAWAMRATHGRCQPRL